MTTSSCDKNQPTVLANSSNHSRARLHTVQNASKQHNHGKCYILSLKKQILGDLKTHLAIEISQNNTLTHGVKLNGGTRPGEGPPIYGLYRYVPRNRVWFLRFSVLK